MAKRRKRRGRGADTGGLLAVVVVVTMVFGLPLLAALWRWVDANRTAVGLALVAVAAVAGLVVWKTLQRRWARFQAQRRVETTDGMPGPEFERFIARLMRASGFRKVQVCGGAGDRGADIVAVDPAGRRVVVQCKSWAKSVGSPEIQKFNGTAWTVHRAQVAMVVTNSTFTRPAQAEAEAHDILMVDRTALGRWLALDEPPYDLGTRPRRPLGAG